MLRSRLMVPAAAMALTVGLGLTAVGFWAGRTFVQVMTDHMISEMTQAVHREVGHVVRL